ncbi:C-type cytochrome biogenesis protein ResA (Thioredoxin) [Burkholderiales bacterium]|nr:C-type cytochrome biogenesis protein ResA (Thioredoxin) [Burkholderiales bacterium]
MWNHAQAPRPADALASRQLYGITLEDADGHAQSLSQWRGKILVVNFWATWCAPCVAEMPDLDKLQQEYSERNVAIIGIGIENRDRVRQFRDRLGLRMTLLAGGFDSLGLARSFGDDQGVLPYTALLSADGRLLKAHAGALGAGQLRQWLDATQ